MTSFALMKQVLTIQTDTLTTFYIMKYLQLIHVHLGGPLVCQQYITEVSRIYWEM